MKIFNSCSVLLELIRYVAKFTVNQYDENLFLSVESNFVLFSPRFISRNDFDFYRSCYEYDVSDVLPCGHLIDK